MSETNNNLRSGKRSAAGHGPSLFRGLLGPERALVVVCVVVGAAVGAWRLWTATPQYAATARLYVEPLDAMDNVQGAATGGKTSIAWSPPTDLLLGTEVGGLAVQLGNLRSIPCFANAPDLPLRIVSNLEVKSSPAQSGPGQMQDLRYTCVDGKAAEQVLESVISAYEIAAEQWRSQRLADTLGVLESQRTLLFDRLQQKQAELQRFLEANPSAFRASDSLVLDNRLKALVEARIRAEIRRIEAEVRLATMQAAASSDPAGGEANPAGAPFDASALNALMSSAEFGGAISALPGMPAESPAANVRPPSDDSVLDDRPAPLTNAVVSDAIDLDAEARHVQRLENTWGPDHPKLQAAKDRLADLKQRVRRQADNSVRTAEAWFTFCRDEEERLQRAIDAQRTAVTPGAASESAVQAQILQQVVDRSSKLLAAVCARIDHLSLESAAAGTSGVKITTVVPPHAAPVLVSDQGPKLFLVPLGVGLLIGFILTYLRGARTAPAVPVRAAGFGPRKVAPDDVVLGWVPALPTDGGRGSQRTLGTWVLREQGSKAAKAFRRIAKHLLRAAARRDARCLLVSSAEARQGKSVVLANVATAVAQAGRKVLLIDANYDHPSQHVLLSDILSLEAAPDEISVEALERGRAGMRTQMETLWVVPAWPKPARPVEILESTALHEFIRRSASKYDLILIDAPPLSRRDEIEMLAESADAVVYVANAANASAQNEREMLRRLDLPGIGIIVNTVPAVGPARSTPGAKAARGAAPARSASRRSARREPAGRQPDDAPEMQAVLSGDAVAEPPEPSY